MIACTKAQNIHLIDYLSQAYHFGLNGSETNQIAYGNLKMSVETVIEKKNTT